MSIKEAHRLCPQGVYMHPNPRKHKEASDKIKTGDAANRADDTYRAAEAMLDKIEKNPVRLVEASLSGLTKPLPVKLHLCMSVKATKKSPFH